jgi:hypothetical protein
MLLLSGSSIQAQEDADEVARRLSNPAEPNWSLTSNFDATWFGGDLPNAQDQFAVNYLFQPAIPTPIESIGYNLLFRPAIPVFFNQPIYDGGTSEFSSSGFQLGNISFDLALGTTTESGLLYFFGVVGSLPTATLDDIKGQWAFGPEFAVGVAKPWGVVGALVSHQWDVEGGVEKTNVTGGQYFYAFTLGGGWQIAAGPTYSYNWETDAFTLPLGTGVARTVFAGTTPIKLSTQLWYFVSRPDAFGSDWVLRITIAPVIGALW